MKIRNDNLEFFKLFLKGKKKKKKRKRERGEIEIGMKELGGNEYK